MENGILDEILEGLLQLADLVKFAREDPLPVDNQTNLNNAYLFVQKTYPMFYMEKPEQEKMDKPPKMAESEEKSGSENEEQRNE